MIENPEPRTLVGYGGQCLSQVYQPRQPRKLAIQPRLRTTVVTLLAPRWSPEPIRSDPRDPRAA